MATSVDAHCIECGKVPCHYVSCGHPVCSWTCKGARELHPNRRPFFVNDVPINDPLCVLDLLYTDRWEWKADRSLILPNAYTDLCVPTLRVALIKVRYFRVDVWLGERMLAEGTVAGRAHWGGTNDHDLSITDSGRRVVRDAYEKAGMPYSFGFSRRLRTERWYEEGVRLRWAP